MPTADLSAVVLVFDWLETEYADWKSPTEERPFEVEYEDPGDMMAEHIRDGLAERGWTLKWTEGPNVTAAVAVFIEIDTPADVEAVVRDMNEIIPWKHGSRGELSKK